jgi:hypothetical protein
VAIKILAKTYQANHITELMITGKLVIQVKKLDKEDFIILIKISLHSKDVFL